MSCLLCVLHLLVLLITLPLHCNTDDINITCTGNSLDSSRDEVQGPCDEYQWQVNVTVLEDSNTAAVIWWGDICDNIMLEIQDTSSTTNNAYVNGRNYHILLNLSPSTTYTVKVSTENCTCQLCRIVRVELGDQQNPQFQIRNVWSHVYHPYKESDNEIAATIVWEPLSRVLQPTYEISIQDYKQSTIETFYSSTSNVDIIRRNEINELVFPLQKDTQYIARVRIDGRVWSEPIELDTSKTSSAFELFVTSTNRGTLLSRHQHRLDHVNIAFTNNDMGFPTALDKRNRWVYYLATCSSTFTCIYKTSIPFHSNSSLNTQETSQIYNFSSLYTPIDMTYDWIGKVLSIIVQDTNELKIIQVLVNNGDVREIKRRNVTQYYDLSDHMIEMIIANPFTSLLNVIERSSIVKFDLKSLDWMGRDNSINDTVSSVEDVRSGCLYYINQNGNIRAAVNINECSYNDLNVTQGMAEIALDDSRLYYAAKNDDNIDAITTYNTSQLRDEWYNLSTAFTNLLSIEATSPGTQPLPYDINCLSPNFTQQENRPRVNVTLMTPSSVSIEWTVKWDCPFAAYSRPPLQYTIFVESPSGPVDGYYNKTTFLPALEIVGLIPNTNYNISVLAYNEFTTTDQIGFKGTIPIMLPPDPLATSSTVMPSTTTTTMMSTRAITVDVTPTDAIPVDNQSTTIAAIGGAVGAAVLIVILTVVAILVVAIVAYSRTRTRKPKESVSTNHWVPNGQATVNGSSGGTTRYIEGNQNHQYEAVGQAKTATPSISIAPYLRSASDNYATPIDSLNQYLSTSGGQQYEVPSQTNTLRPLVGGHTSPPPYLTINTQELDPDNIYTTPLPVASPDPPEPSPYSTPIPSQINDPNPTSPINSQMTDNPVYFELENSAAHIQAVEPTYFELENPSTKNTPQEPTYFELENPKA